MTKDAFPKNTISSVWDRRNKGGQYLTLFNIFEVLVPEYFHLIYTNTPRHLKDKYCIFSLTDS